MRIALFIVVCSLLLGALGYLSALGIAHYAGDDLSSHERQFRDFCFILLPLGGTILGWIVGSSALLLAKRLSPPQGD